MIKKGGYLVSYGPAQPPTGYQVRLGTSSSLEESIDLTGASCHDSKTTRARIQRVRILRVIVYLSSRLCIWYRVRSVPAIG